MDEALKKILLCDLECISNRLERDHMPASAQTIRTAIDQIQRLAAEVERPTPKKMTLEEAVEVINRRYGISRLWTIKETPHGIEVVQELCGVASSMSPFATIAVAEKLLRDKKEAAK